MRKLYKVLMSATRRTSNRWGVVGKGRTSRQWNHRPRDRSWRSLTLPVAANGLDLVKFFGRIIIVKACKGWESSKVVRQSEAQATCAQRAESSLKPREGRYITIHGEEARTINEDLVPEPERRGPIRME